MGIDGLPKEIDGLLVSPGIACTLLSVHRLLVNRSALSLPRKNGSSQTLNLIRLVGWLYLKQFFDVMTSHKMKATSRHDLSSSSLKR